MLFVSRGDRSSRGKTVEEYLKGLRNEVFEGGCDNAATSTTEAAHTAEPR